MKHTKLLGLPVYGLAVVMVLFPLAETLVVALPIRAEQVGWRFGTVGLLSRALMTPLLGVLLAYAAALLLGHRGVLRTVSVLSVVTASGLLGLIALFILDALQMRAQVGPDSIAAFDLATGFSIVKHGVAAILLALFGAAAWNASRSGSASPERTKGADLLLTRLQAERATL